MHIYIFHPTQQRRILDIQYVKNSQSQIIHMFSTYVLDILSFVAKKW